MATKDPAFLFYSKDFYEGTRMMLPEERACYVDLMIYQHQHGVIPVETKRVLLYCNGISEATLQATLQAKFKLTAQGWVNDKLKFITNEREEFTKKQSLNGAVGQFWKKAKAILSKKEYTQLRDLLYNQSNIEIYNLIKGCEVSEASLKAMLEAMLKHLANANANAIININNIEGVQGEAIPEQKELLPPVDLTPAKSSKKKEESLRFTKPTVEQIRAYCEERKNGVDAQYFYDKNESIGWVVGKNRTPVKDWKAVVRTWEKYTEKQEVKNAEPIKAVFVEEKKPELSAEQQEDIIIRSINNAYTEFLLDGCEVFDLRDIKDNFLIKKGLKTGVESITEYFERMKNENKSVII